jgi:hypothetical protein
MADNNLGRRWLYAAGGAALLAALTALAPPAGAQDAPKIGETSVGPATAVDLATAPVLPAVPMPAGLTINRPTMPEADYRAQQQRPPGPPSALKTAPRTPGPGSGLSLYFQSGSIFQGQPGTSTSFPPDGDIATSQHFTVQTVNFEIVMYNLDNGTLAKQVSFATFFGDASSFLFDPRIIYDPVWQRFVVLADGCNPCNSPNNPIGVSFYKLAISQTSDPTGGYWIYQGSLPEVVGDFADFPQMGMDLHSIIVTYNDFLANGGFDARTFAISKAYLYNGLGYGVPVFGGSGCTIAPPYVLDNHGPSYTMVACPGDNGVYLGPMYNTGLTNVSLTHWQAKVAVGAYNSPPCAPQPGVAYCLDTSDARFENRSAQIGNRIWNVHTILDGTATAQWYEFNTDTSALVNSSIWFVTGSSSDWHPSMVVNGVGATGSSPTGETFGTWMSVDANNNLNLQLRAIGANGTADDAGTGGGIAVGPASATALTNQTFNGNRAGDYSYISLFPGPVGACQANEFAILEGEVAHDLTHWGTRIGIVKHC